MALKWRSEFDKFVVTTNFERRGWEKWNPSGDDDWNVFWVGCRIPMPRCPLSRRAGSHDDAFAVALSCRCPHRRRCIDVICLLVRPILFLLLLFLRPAPPFPHRAVATPKCTFFTFSNLKTSRDRSAALWTPSRAVGHLRRAIAVLCELQRLTTALVVTV